MAPSQGMRTLPSAELRGPRPPHRLSESPRRTVGDHQRGVETHRADPRKASRLLLVHLKADTTYEETLARTNRSLRRRVSRGATRSRSPGNERRSHGTNESPHGGPTEPRSGVEMPGVAGDGSIRVRQARTPRFGDCLFRLRALPSSCEARARSFQPPCRQSHSAGGPRSTRAGRCCRPQQKPEWTHCGV
jgi:hypothetical protein